LGRNAIPHGTESPVATVRRAGVAVAVAVGVAPSGVSFGVAVAGAVVAFGAAGSGDEEPHAPNASAASATDVLNTTSATQDRT
jgi:mannitol/fructose-specific phosphotransferase system IIA component